MKINVYVNSTNGYNAVKLQARAEKLVNKTVTKVLNTYGVKAMERKPAFGEYILPMMDYTLLRLVMDSLYQDKEISRAMDNDTMEISWEA